MPLCLQFKQVLGAESFLAAEDHSDLFDSNNFRSALSETDLSYKAGECSLVRDPCVSNRVLLVMSSIEPGLLIHHSWARVCSTDADVHTAFCHEPSVHLELREYLC